MTVHIIFQLLLLGHILGDFYLQPNKMAEEKKEHSRAGLAWLLGHGAIYTACMGAVLFLCVPYEKKVCCVWAAASLLHFLVDLFKRYINGFVIANKKNENKKFLLYLNPKIYIIDQLLHLSTLLLVWFIWGKNLPVHPFILDTVPYFPHRSVFSILLGLLIILRPVGIFIRDGGLLKEKDASQSSNDGIGKRSGYLERFIVYLLLLLQQYTAVAFVISAKSIMRFPEINKESSGASGKAEYYLVGMLLSMASVFAVFVALGMLSA
jgi:hypothetical protein